MAFPEWEKTEGETDLEWKISGSLADVKSEMPFEYLNGNKQKYLEFRGGIQEKKTTENHQHIDGI